MNPWIAKGVVFAAVFALIAIRAPYGSRSRRVKVVKSWKGRLEVFLLTLVWIGSLIPLLWIFSPALYFAEYPLRPVPFAIGIVCYVAGLWLFYRSHVDLGTNWSITLELREQHSLVTAGVYRRVRHPMYVALFLYSIGQALVLPNWIAGPACLVAFGILYALRVNAEERMMIEQFGDEYVAYMSRTKRLVPGVW